ncbi:hypothetical protein BC830DRAFT_1172191 [Chytriomyces sp. MP71]|nr:hypothetical protein BC830DRAFT_1172191 [Chytriomyces sp. MP71]
MDSCQGTLRLPELLSLICMYLPIDRHLRNVGLASRRLYASCPVTSGSHAFALGHVAEARRRTATIFFEAFTNAFNLDVNEHFCMLPFRYKTALFSLAFERDSFMLLHWWTVSDRMAVRVALDLIVARGGGFNVTFGGSAILKWATAKEAWSVIRILLCCGMHPGPSQEYLADLNLSQAQLDGIARQPRIDPNVSCNQAMRIACMHGKLSVVQLLLLHESVNPGAWENVAFYLAAMHGREEIVSLLLEDSRVDPCACNGRALDAAVKGGHRGIVRLLRGDDRVSRHHSERSLFHRSLASWNIFMTGTSLLVV